MEIYRKMTDVFCRRCPYKNRGYANLSYSHEGEDLILERLFTGKQTGVFVDIGAHHPQRFSNSYSFYLKGWRGLNVDAMPGSMDAFRLIRPLDINLEIAVSDAQREMNFYVFEETALNTFLKELADQYLNEGWKLKFTQKIKTHTLADVLDRYLEKDQQIDFLNIDVEGLDYEVLTSNNWSKYRPEVILIEELQGNDLQLTDSKIPSFMKSKGYVLSCKTVSTLIYKQSHLPL